MNAVHLTKREEEVMQALWSLKKAFTKEIIAELPIEPKPPYNTIASIVRKLVDRKLVGYEAFGKTHRYYPILQKSHYRNMKFQRFVGSYFGGSATQLLSYFVKQEKVEMEELEELLEKIKQSRENS